MLSFIILAAGPQHTTAGKNMEENSEKEILLLEAQQNATSSEDQSRENYVNGNENEEPLNMKETNTVNGNAKEVGDTVTANESVKVIVRSEENGNDSMDINEADEMATTNGDSEDIVSPEDNRDDANNVEATEEINTGNENIGESAETEENADEMEKVENTIENADDSLNAIGKNEDKTTENVLFSTTVGNGSSLFLAVAEANLLSNEEYLRPKDDATWNFSNSDPHKQQLNLTNYLVDSMEDVAELIKDHEEKHNVRFASYYCSKDFGKTDLTNTKSQHKVFWEDEDFRYTGIPFFIVGRKKMDCQHGKDRNTAVKKQRKDEKMKQMMYDGSPATRKKRAPMTKKHNCPAQVYMKEIIHFPDLRLKQDSKFRRIMGSKKLRKILKSETPTTMQRKILVAIPDVSSHENHDVAKVIETGAEYFENLSSELSEINAELAEIEAQLSPLINKKEALTEKKREIEQTIQYHSPETTLFPVSSDPFNWSSRVFFWTEEIEKALKNVFRLEVFRKMQRETINATLWGKDCLLILPPGAGKSICFQLPAAISEGFTLVVAPLISLIQDQVLRLINHHVNATSLTATSSDLEVQDVISQMVDKDSTLKILYITPDILSKSKEFIESLEKAVQAGCLSRIVIDEVHCASQLGHNFRTDYQDLGFLRQQFPKVPILGLTSTATENVVQDLKVQLCLQEDCLVFRSSFNRPNLFYEVRVSSVSSESQLDEIADIINTEFSQLSGIVYCISSKEAEHVLNELINRGVNAGSYHEDLDDQTKENNHFKWINNELQVIVATAAFGMGIDKPNVRFVIHYTISKSIQNYYQESGRAGRDGNPAKCIAFYRFPDVFRHSTMVFTEQTGLENLHSMMHYCIELKPCRRALLSRHFGETWDRDNCNEMCDNCVRMRSDSSLMLTKDITRHARDVFKLLNHAASLNERLTPFKVVSGWMGKGKPELRVLGMKIPNYPREDCEHIVAQLIINGALKEEFHHTACSIICYLSKGPNAEQILQGEKTLKMHCEKKRKISQPMAILAATSGKTVSENDSENTNNKPQKRQSTTTATPRSAKQRKLNKDRKDNEIKAKNENVINEIVIDEAIIDPNTLKFEIGADGQSFIILNQVVDHNEYTSQLKFIENDITEAIVVETT